MARYLLDAGFRTIVVSRPGYLGTPLTSGRTPVEQADLYAALLDALGIDRVGVCCWSGGGPSAYRFAVQHPGRTIGLVALAAVAGRFDLRPEAVEEKVIMGTAFGRGLLKLMAKATPQQLIAATIGSEGALTKEQVKERTGQVMADERAREFVLALAATANRSGPRKAGYDNDVEQMAGSPGLELERISVPTLLVHGAVDSDVPPEESRTAVAAIPGAELVELDAGTHLAFFINPAAPAAREQAFAVLRG